MTHIKTITIIIMALDLVFIQNASPLWLIVILVYIIVFIVELLNEDGDTDIS